MRFFKWLLLLLLLLLLLWLIWQLTHKKTVTVKNYINWNLVFQPGLTRGQRDSIVSVIKRDINNVSSSNPPASFDSFSLYFNNSIYNDLNRKGQGKFKLKNATEHYCSCNDSLLWNLQADLEVDSTGGSTPVTSRPKGPRPQGGIEWLANNDSINKPEATGSIFKDGGKLNFPGGFSFLDSGFISVIDTGIDSTLLEESLRKGIVSFGDNGSRNLLIGGDPRNYGDSNSVRHGTSVASIILNEYYRQDAGKKLPRLLVYKALSDSGHGDLFALCCAIMHSIQSNASVINVSAGYYGDANAVLDHYLHLSRIGDIPVVAAAGNFTGGHDSSICSETKNPGASLDSITLFYPACSSVDTVQYNVVSVTGLMTRDIPCYYQNYSGNYVTIGVVNDVADTNCCAFTLPYFKDSLGLEGSSFATPVVSGRLGHALINGPHPASYTDLIHRLTVSPLTGPPPGLTKFYMMN